MTDHTQARAEGRAEGIREAADKAAIYRDSCTDGGMKAIADTIRSSVLALIETPAPTQPAQVSVAEGVRPDILASHMCRELRNAGYLVPYAALTKAMQDAALRDLSENRT